MRISVKLKNFILESNLIFRISFSLLLIFYGYYLYTSFDSLFSRNENSNLDKYKIEFFHTMDKVVSSKDSSLINIVTFKRIFNSLDRESDGSLFSYGFINTLEDYLNYLINDTTSNKYNSLNPVLKMIENEIAQEPFTQLTTEQRRILKNLENSIHNNDTKTATYNLLELNDILRISNDEMTKLETQNSWSIPLAFLGALLTLLFGLISIFRPISYKLIDRMIKKQLNKEQ